jgi:cytochrome b involved in lipid metabolism
LILFEAKFLSLQRYGVPDSFVARHPGGVDAIMLGKGRNCTELFESYHSLTDKPAQVLAPFFVENAQPGDADFDTSFDWDNDKAAFYAELKSETRKFFAGKSHKATWKKWAVVACFVALCALTFVFGFLRGRWWAPFAMPVQTSQKSYI